ncbi:MAG: TerC family protein [Acetobacter sp.]
MLAFLQVILIDITLAGDNAVVIGMVVRRLSPEQRRIAILIGVLCAAVIRLGLALVATRLLEVIGLTFAGGLLLLWVCWRMYRELRHTETEASEDNAPPKSLATAVFHIVLADLSMSLDNVLAVAGAAAEHTWVLVSGLAVSVILMATAASFIARLLGRWPWISWVGLLIVFGVAVELIIRGGNEISAHLPF